MKNMEAQIDFYEMHKHLTPEEDLSVMRTMGGIVETMRTGIYPDKLRIASFKYNHDWRIKVKDDYQLGVLRIKRVAVYNYKMNDEKFYVQQVVNSVTVSDWVLVEMDILMVD